MTTGISRPAAAVAGRRPLQTETLKQAQQQQQPKLPMHEQERAIVDDLLMLALACGDAGDYLEWTRPQIEMDSRFDASWLPAVERFRTLLNDTRIVHTFAEQLAQAHFGVVNHALAASIREILHELRINVARLENQHCSTAMGPGGGPLTVAQLWSAMQDHQRIVHVLALLVRGWEQLNSGEVSGRPASASMGVSSATFVVCDGQKVPFARGGRVLNVLHLLLEKWSGDTMAKKILMRLYFAAIQPYLDLLRKWIHAGQLEDTYHEFLLVERPGTRNREFLSEWDASWWDHRFQLRTDEEEMKVAHMLLSATSASDGIEGREARLDALKRSFATKTSTSIGGGGSTDSLLNVLDSKAAAIAASPSAHGSEWEMSRSMMPRVFQQSIQLIVLSGKYWNVVKQCGGGPSTAVLKSEEREQDEVGSGMARRVGRLLIQKPRASAEEFWATGISVLRREIEDAYQLANKNVLKMLFGEYQLLARLQLVKSFYFTDRGDYMVHFMDSAFDELRGAAREMDSVKLQSLFDLAVHSSSLKTASEATMTDRNGPMSSVLFGRRSDEPISVKMAKMSLMEQLVRIMSVTGIEMAEDGVSVRSDGEYARSTSWEQLIAGSEGKVLSGLHALVLEYDAPFPVSLVLSKKALVKYQIIFRHIFSCKSVERQLSLCWIDHQAGHKKTMRWLLSLRGAKPLRTAAIRPDDQLALNDDIMPDPLVLATLNTVLNRAYNLRAKMLHFIQTLMGFMFTEVLEPQWSTMWSQLKNCNTVEMVVEKHSDFLDTCLKECLLTNKKLFVLQHQLIQACSSFSNQTERFMKSLLLDPTVVLMGQVGSGAPSATSAHATPSRLHRSPLETYSTVLEKAGAYFDSHVARLLSSLEIIMTTECDIRVRDLVQRLDLNGFYASHRNNQSSQASTVEMSPRV